MRKRYLVLLLCCAVLTGCGSNNAPTENTEKEEYVTVGINISDDTEEESEISNTDEVKQTITYSEEEMKKVLSESCYMTFSQYTNNGQDTVLKYTAEANTSNKVYHITDETNKSEYWNDFANLVFYKVKDGKVEQVRDSITSLNVSERELENCYDLWVALSKNFAIKDGAEGFIEDRYAYFTTTTEVEEDDVTGLEYTKLGSKEITHIFNVNDDGTLGSPKSLTVTIYYTVDNKEYTVSTSLNFNQFTVSTLEIPDMTKYSSVSENTTESEEIEKVDD